jgi:hypothetical protein
MGIPVWKRGAVSFDSPYGNRDSPFLYGDVLIPISIWEWTYGNGEPNLLPYYTQYKQYALLSITRKIDAM